MALYGWLHMLLRRGLPRFTAYNCLPLHRCRFSKYDSLILMCLGKTQPKHWCRFACLGKSLQVSPNYISHLYPKLICKQRDDIIVARPPIGVALIDDGNIESQLSFPGPVLSLHASKKDNTCPILNGKFVLRAGGCLASTVCREVVAFSGKESFKLPLHLWCLILFYHSFLF